MPRALAVALAVALAALAGCSASSDVSRTLGARCDTADECDDRCLPPASFPGGFCSVSCERAADCPDRAACADLEGGVCLLPCVADPDCTFLGAGWTCLAVATREDPARQVKVCRGAP